MGMRGKFWSINFFENLQNDSKSASWGALKVWVKKTCTHIFTHSTILCQFFKNMYYFEEIRLVEHSKLLRQVKILQKMCPLNSHLKKKKNFTFSNFYVKSTYKVFGQFFKMSAIDKAKFNFQLNFFTRITSLKFFWYFKAACVCWKLVCKVQRRLNS